jgi:NADH dehydrogenase FAD-containing subunit
VYAVRQAPVLWENIRRTLAGRPLRAFRPQRRFLKILNTGDGRAIAEFGSLVIDGRCVWRWKDTIDRRFVARYQIVE